LEATEFALAKTDPRNLPRKKLVPTALKMAHEIGLAFDEIALKSWLAFAEPAQDMAWRGYSEAEIISAAVNTSPNTYVRTIGYLIAELAGITPTPPAEIRETYSP